MGIVLVINNLVAPNRLLPNHCRFKGPNRIFDQIGNKSCVMDGIITKCPKIRNKRKVKAKR
jgi:hypothetical protein